MEAGGKYNCTYIKRHRKKERLTESKEEDIIEDIQE